MTTSLAADRPGAAAPTAPTGPAVPTPAAASSGLAYLPPNWFAAVMGTGIVAVAAAGLPVQFPGLRAFAILMWAIAALLLVVLTVATAVHWRHHPATARGYLSHPVLGHFYGAPPMALMTVGAATLLLGQHILGARLALDVDWTLWSAGTLLGLMAFAWIPYRTSAGRAKVAFGGWLMPVVPPMVSASTGALLIPHAPTASVRIALLIGCYTMFTIALVGSAVVIALICLRLGRHGPPPPQLVPTLWIVLGPLGQSVTAANLLGGDARRLLSAGPGAALQAFGLSYAVPALGFALLWSVIAGRITYRTARPGLPFAMTWWSFTFPLGTCVTALSGLSLRTHVGWLGDGAALLFLVLVAAWLLVASKTASGLREGRLLQAPASQPAP
ncbi:C4-dicarboxylate transporter/malic acid transport protein [Jatrophihabitans sp. GAS493]|uniref:TDT family transporter n=1 Tax=Jatrophihabitans sp. GAS493 TaxID=1907575 RepID=UPI000BC0171E|nr:TDT family transporter [Jatrophihabitans sp. GAS493]SOD74521.1 C4-dicarboxylate transporter/malic acid transport protein [Jatrophihabitans sp. GAS493]